MENKKPVSLRAVTARINRALSKDGKKLVKNSPKWASGYGEYSIVNTSTNVIEAHHVEIEKLARDEGCLHGWEEVSG